LLSYYCPASDIRTCHRLKIKLPGIGFTVEATKGELPLKLPSDVLDLVSDLGDGGEALNDVSRRCCVFKIQRVQRGRITVPSQMEAETNVPGGEHYE